MRHLLIAVELCILASGANGQPALVNHDVVTAKTCVDSTQVQSSSVEAAQSIVVAVMADTVSDVDLVSFRKEVTSLYQAVKNAPSLLRLATISGSTVTFSGPFRTRTQLQAAVADLGTKGPERPVPPEPVQIYSNLAAAVQQIGPDWPTLILVGNFPSVKQELTAFTTAWLAAQFRAAKVRVNYWTPSGEASELLDSAVPTAAGAHVTDGWASFARDLSQAKEFREVSWQDSLPAAGLRVCSVILADSDGQAVLKTASIGASTGLMIPDLAHYAFMREKVHSLSDTLKQNPLSAEQVNQAERDLNAALEIGPLEEETLRLGEALYRRQGNDGRLAKILDTLSTVVPADPAVLAELGHARFRKQDWDAAERALLRARELKPGDASVAEDLARIRLEHKDDRGALAFLEERLALGTGTQALWMLRVDISKRLSDWDRTADSIEHAIELGANTQELWLLRADVADRLGNWQRNADSVEHAISLGEVSLERRAALIRQYLQHENPDRALVHVRAVAAVLPSDGVVRAEYAGFLDQLNQPAEALIAWKRTLEADPKLELAHFRVTRLLIEKNSLPEALEAAEAGIQVAPTSARLILAKAEVLEKQDHFYDARHTLREAAPSLPDPTLLARLAEMEDAGGEHAGRVYRSLVDATEKAGTPDPQLTATLQRGLEASLREADLDTVAWFQSRLGMSPKAAPGAGGGTVTVPGGLAALSLIAGSKPSSPETFLMEYARTVSEHLFGKDKKVAEAYTEAIRQHFKRVSELAALGMPQGDHVTVTISIGDKNAQRNAEKVLELLGWKMRTLRQEVKLEPAESGERAKHQETATALAIDEVGMQQALESGKPFTFDIPMDNAYVVLGEATWKKQFYANEHYSGGLAEAIAGNLALAQTFAALGQIDLGTAQTLESGIGLKTLADKWPLQLHSYASALAIEHGHVAVPGGDAAAPIWDKVVGASSAQPEAFFRALLNKDDGKMLAYYAALGSLDIRHQRMFTRTPARTTRFYELFKEAPETRSKMSKVFSSGSFVEFLSEIPLDDDGNVDFPGSPEVWMVAKGQSHSESNAARMLRKMKRKATPDQEDEILLRLARTHYKESFERSELDNFIAVVRIDQHREDPLDENSALLLAQHYADDGPAYPFFSILTGLQQKQFEQFFALATALRSLSTDERGVQLGSIYALIKIVCLSQESGALSPPQAADVFGKIVERFQKVDSRAARTAASLDLIREILASAAPNQGDPDKAMRSLLLRASGAGENREKRYQQVLELQKIPSLAAVFALSDAARNLAAGKGAPENEIHTLEARASELDPIEIPKELKLNGKERGYIEGFRPRRLEDLVKEFKEKTSKKKVASQELGKLTQDYLEEMDAPVRWALVGIIYAYFLDPADLLVSEDPLLLRKHQFFTTTPSQRSAIVFEPGELAQSSEKAGSYFTGGLVDFGSVAGKAAVRNQKLGGDYGAFIAAKQITALRSTNWGALRDEDLRLLGLKVAVAREWIVHAASAPEIEAALAEDTLGLLSLARRTGLRAAIAQGDWLRVWSGVTLSDLYFLGDRYLTRYSMGGPWQSPAARALRDLAARNSGDRLQLLGAEFDETFGCSHPHLMPAPPYEQYESDLVPDRLAERSAEFKLYFARYANSAGLPAAAMGSLAEPLARVILSKMKLSDFHDWRSAIAAYAALDQKLILEAEAK